MARLQKHRRSKALPFARKNGHPRYSLSRATSGPRRILRYIFGSRKKRYSWTLFRISTVEPFFVAPSSPESMQIHLDLDGGGGVSGNTRGSHSPHRGSDGLQVRNRRSVITSGSTIGSLSFSPKTFLVGDSPGGGRRNASDGDPVLSGFAPSGKSRANSDSDSDSGKDLWLVTYKYFKNQNQGGARKERVSIASSASKDDAGSSDGYRADFDLEADPWLLTYNFLDSINEQDTVHPRETEHKELETIREGPSLRRKRNNEDIRSKWAHHSDDYIGILPIPRPSTNNELETPVYSDTRQPPAQQSCPSHPPVPSMPPLSNPLPSKYFPKPKTHLSHQGSGSRYPPLNLRIGVPAIETPLPDPEPPTPLPMMQTFEAVPLSDGVGESGVLVNWDNSREGDLFGIPGSMNLEDQRPKTAPNRDSVNRTQSERRYSAYAQQAATEFAYNHPTPVNRFPTILRSGQASPHFNAHLDFSFDSLGCSSPPCRMSDSPVHAKPTSRVTAHQSSSSSPPPPSPPHSPVTTTAPSPSRSPDLASFTFPFETSHSPSLKDKIDEEYEAALGRWSGELYARRIRRSRDVRECIRRLRECTEFDGGLGWRFS